MAPFTRSRQIGALVAAVVVLVFQGCSGPTDAPSQPVQDGIANPDFLQVEWPPDGMTVGVDSLFQSGRIDGSKGGSLTCGRFKVDVPKGAYKGWATISITVSDPSQLQCDLNISPASLNHFAIPVMLITDCSGTTATDPTRMVELWCDPALNLWYPVAGYQVDLLNLTVTAPLSHFSHYGTAQGKAGW